VGTADRRYDLQETVNTSGDIGVIVGKAGGGHGHITIVVPESASLWSVAIAECGGDGDSIRLRVAGGRESNFGFGAFDDRGCPVSTRRALPRFIITFQSGLDTGLGYWSHRGAGTGPVCRSRFAPVGFRGGHLRI